MFSFFGRWQSPHTKQYTTESPPELLPELWLLIFQHVSLYDLACLMHTNKEFLSLARSNQLFKIKFQQYFPNISQTEIKNYYQSFATNYDNQFKTIESKKTRQLLNYIYEKAWNRIPSLTLKPQQLYATDSNNISILRHIKNQQDQTLFDQIFKQVEIHIHSNKLIGYYRGWKEVDNFTYKLAIACGQVDFVLNHRPHFFVNRETAPRDFVLAYNEYLHVCAEFDHANLYTILCDMLDEDHRSNNSTHIEYYDHNFSLDTLILTAANNNSVSIIHLLAAKKSMNDPHLRDHSIETANFRRSFFTTCERQQHDAFIALSSYFPSVLEQYVLGRNSRLTSAINQGNENILKFICSKVDISKLILTIGNDDFLDEAFVTNYLGGIQYLLEHGAKLSDELLATLDEYKLNGIKSVLHDQTPTDAIPLLVNLFELLDLHWGQNRGTAPRPTRNAY